MRHSLTGAALTDLLLLISLHCLEPNSLSNTLFLFKKFFAKWQFPVKMHRYCNICLTELPLDNICTKCLKKRSFQVNASLFLEIPIISQLRTLFSREGFYDDLQYRFNRVKKNPDNIEDIYDGNIYKQFMKEGFLSVASNISFMWNTDGVSLFNSSNFSIWPLYLRINELPPQKRCLTENMIICGIWFGKGKPNMNYYITQFHQSFTDLITGIDINIPNRDHPVLVKAIVLSGTCDLPAKCLVLNMHQFNGAYGCAKCKQKGETFNTANRGHKHVYPFDKDNFKGPKRTHYETMLEGERATIEKKVVNGIKGPSVLSLIVRDIINSTAVDVMHTVYLGVMKKLLGLWFDGKHSNCAFSLSKFKEEISNRMISITPPNFVQRVPRSLRDLHYWKASELKNFLFYYSLPLLSDILPKQFLEHHIALVTATFIVSQDSISPKELDLADKLYLQYVFMFEELYGLEFMTAVVHQLLHLTDDVYHLGPTWVSSNFPFEDINGKLMKLVHGTQHPEIQISCAMANILHQPNMLAKLNEGSNVQRFCKSMLSHGKTFKILEKINEFTYSLGSYKNITDRIPVDLRVTLLDSTDEIGKIQIFYKLKVKRFVYNSYTKNSGLKHDSSTIKFALENETYYGQIYYFVKNCLLCDTHENQCYNCKFEYFAYVKILEKTEHQIFQIENLGDFGFHIKDMTNHNDQQYPIHKLIPINNLISPCFLIQSSKENRFFICDPVNTIENE